MRIAKIGVHLMLGLMLLTICFMAGFDCRGHFETECPACEFNPTWTEVKFPFNYEGKSFTFSFWVRGVEVKAYAPAVVKAIQFSETSDGS